MKTDKNVWEKIIKTWSQRHNERKVHRVSFMYCQEQNVYYKRTRFPPHPYQSSIPKHMIRVHTSVINNENCKNFR